MFQAEPRLEQLGLTLPKAFSITDLPDFRTSLSFACFEWRAKRAAQDRAALIFFAGRIDNASALADRCDAATKDLADTLVQLYARFGTACADMVLGDFVIAIWDPHKQAIICFRDVSGCGIAYYHCDDRRFVIATTIAELVEKGDLSTEIDNAFAFRALSRPFNHPERTFLSAVKKIPPAQIVTLTPGGYHAERYWNPRDIAPMDVSDPQAIHARFRAVFQQAVADRLPRQDTIGVHLSGGLDCSSVAIVAAELLRNAGRAPPHAFAWQPRPDDPETCSGSEGRTWREYSEQEYAIIDAAADAAQLSVEYCPLTKEDCLENWVRDETLGPAGSGAYGEWPVQRRAQERGVTTILSGFGGDEVASFNGRGYVAGLALRLRWITLFRFARANGQNGVKAILRGLRTGLASCLLPEAVLDCFVRERPFGVARWKCVLRGLSGRSHTEFLLSPTERVALSHVVSFANKDALPHTRSLPFWRSVRQITAHHAMRRSFERGHLSERIEGWAVDGARRGITYAYPLLDKRVLEFVFALPEDAFQSPTQQRLFFRRAMAPILPASICEAPKGTEEARAGVAMQVGCDALAEFGRLLKQGKISSPRLKYIDRDRLVRALEPDSLRNRTGVAKLLLAVQFIGLHKK